MIDRVPVLAVLLVGPLLACGTEPAPKAEPAPKTEPDSKAELADRKPVASADGPAAPTKVDVPTTAQPRKNWGAFPPEARRNTAPEGILERAAKKGTSAPGFTLPGAGGSFVLADALAKPSHVALVFYRGAW